MRWNVFKKPTPSSCPRCRYFWITWPGWLRTSTDTTVDMNLCWTQIQGSSHNTQERKTHESAIVFHPPSIAGHQRLINCSVRLIARLGLLVYLTPDWARAADYSCRFSSNTDITSWGVFCITELQRSVRGWMTSPSAGAAPFTFITLTIVNAKVLISGSSSFTVSLALQRTTPFHLSGWPSQIKRK